MAIYSYSQGSVIDEIRFQQSAGGSNRAYLHANSTVSEKTLSEIAIALAKRGWQAVPNSMNGKPTLEIRGFSRASQITDELAKNNWVNGSPKIQIEKQDSVKFGDTVKNRSLFLSGLVYIIGDASFFHYGKKNNSPFDMAAGLSYFGGTASSLLFARKDASDLQVKEVANKMAAYMRAQNINVPDSCSVSSITNDKHKGLIKKADDYFRHYPAEMMNSFFGLAGTCIAIAAMRNKVFGKVSDTALKDMLAKEKISTQAATAKIKNQMRKSGLLDVGLGSLTVASAAFGNIVEEKARDPDSPKKHGLDAVWEWAQERPLAVTGIGYMVSTMFHAASTVSDWRHADSATKKTVAWRGLFVFSNLLAEVLLAISSKGHGKGVISDKSVGNTAISLAGELIATQPARTHDLLIDYMAGFLGRDDVLAMKDKDVKNMLKTQVELMKKNPWAKCIKTLDIPDPIPEKSKVTNDGHKSNWQTVTKSSQNQNSAGQLI